MFNNFLQMFSKVIIGILLIVLASRIHCDETSKHGVSTPFNPAGAATGMNSSQGVDPSQENWNVRPLPQVPESMCMSEDAGSLLDLWELRLSRLEAGDQETSTEEPNIIIVMNSEEMMKLIPSVEKNPLFHTKHKLIADNFILDSLSTEEIDWGQNETEGPHGHLVRSMNGNALIFKGFKNTSTLSINGVQVVRHETLPDQKEVFILSHYLFGYEKHIKKALKDFENSKDGNDISETVLIGKLCYNSFPEIPKLDLEENVHVGAENFLQVWAYHITEIKIITKKNSTCSFAPEYEINTIVAVDNEKMKSALPYEQKENPLYLPKFEELIDHFILDSVSADTVNLSDESLLRPEGVTIQSLSGVDLHFKKNEISGILSVNGEKVLNTKGIEKGPTIFVIEDFLFTHLEDVKYAYDLHKKENS